MTVLPIARSGITTAAAMIPPFPPPLTGTLAVVSDIEIRVDIFSQGEIDTKLEGTGNIHEPQCSIISKTYQKVTIGLQCIV